jgi:phage-related tail protein
METQEIQTRYDEAEKACTEIEGSLQKLKTKLDAAAKAKNQKEVERLMKERNQLGADYGKAIHARTTARLALVDKERGATVKAAHWGW